MQNDLALIVQKEELEKSQAEIVIAGFSSFLDEAKRWEKDSKSIVVTDESQVEEMAKARELRLIGKNIRVKAENVRKTMKEQYLRGGRAVDGVANIIKAIIVPIEEHLERQEKFAEILQEERKEKVNAERIATLTPYVEDVALYNLKEMSEEGFQQLLRVSKLAVESQKEAEQKAEAERLENEKKEKAEQERIRKENAQLKIEAEAREKQAEKERAEQEKKLEAEREKARKEAEAREKAERELREKKEADEKAKREAEAKAKAEEESKAEAERQAKLAPDKDKMTLYADAIKTLEAPKGLSDKAQKIVNDAEKKLLAISQEIKSNIINI